MSLHITDDLTWVFVDTEPCQVPCCGPYGCPPSCWSEPVTQLPDAIELVLDGDGGATIALGGTALPQLDGVLDIGCSDCDPGCCSTRAWRSSCLLCLAAGEFERMWLDVPPDRGADQPVDRDEARTVLRAALEHVLSQHGEHPAVDEFLTTANELSMAEHAIDHTSEFGQF